MKDFFANPPMWYWILAAVLAVVYGILTTFWELAYVHDIYVNGEWFKGCRYTYHPKTKDIEIWNFKNGVYIRTECTTYVRKCSYLRWNAPEEDLDE